MFKKITAGICILVLALSVTGCFNKNDGVVIDTSKTQIYVHAVNNGVGYRWLQPLADEFNAMEANSEYQVIITPTDDNISTLETKLFSGITNANLYFGSDTRLTSMIAGNYVIDLKDMYSQKASPEDELTIGEKIIGEEYKRLNTGISGTHNYSLPYIDAINGFIFDYETFVEQGWLDYATAAEDGQALTEQGIQYTTAGSLLKFSSSLEETNYKSGDILLKPGKDGKYGTYDDGQPQTLAQWNQMISIIGDQANPYSAFLYTTKYGYVYTLFAFTNIFAQYLGNENFLNLTQLTGSLKDGDGNILAELSEIDGWKAYQTQLVRDAYSKATEFFADNVLAGANLVHKKSYNTMGTTHRDAQNTFILGYTNTASNPPAALLLDGIWFEGESRSIFNNLESSGETGRGYGQRRYRFMLTPQIPNQIGNKSVVNAMDTGVSFVINNVPKAVKTAGKQDEFLSKCKEFLAYTLTDKNLARFTAEYGIVKPYNYDLTQAQLSGLTPFQRNAWDIYRDTENIDIVRAGLSSYTSLMNDLVVDTTFLTAKIGNITYRYPFNALREESINNQTYVNGLVNSHNQSTWEQYYAQYQNYLD